MHSLLLIWNFVVAEIGIMKFALIILQSFGAGVTYTCTYTSCLFDMLCCSMNII